MDIRGNALWEGWLTNRDGKRSLSPFGSDPVPDVDILVADAASPLPPAHRMPLGEARLAWLPAPALRPGPYGGTAALLAPSEFSGANRHRRGSVRSVALFRRHRDNPRRVSDAALFTACVGARILRADLEAPLQPVEAVLMRHLGLTSLRDVWPRRNSAPMPIPPPERLFDLDVQQDGGEELGALLRLWFDLSLDILVPASLTPVRFGPSLITQEDFDGVISRVAEGMSRGVGTRRWKRVTRADLERRVWEAPVRSLRGEFGVSDVTVAKRCRQMGIPRPPRGYWQRLQAGRDPRQILHREGIEPPRDVARELVRKFGGGDRR